MSDTQVGAELRKMTEFIRLEAQEKAREIQVKADEDFEKDKAALILQEKEVIDAAYEAKFKQASMSLQITRSKANAKARLTLLGAGQKVVDAIFDAAQKKLTEASKDKQGGYQDALRKLILDGMFQLNEDAVAVRCRKADKAAVEKAIKDAAAEFRENTGKPIEVEIEESDPLPDKCAGGVIILGENGKIIIDNTLEARLALLKEHGLPAVRGFLFGENPNRKFRD